MKMKFQEIFTTPQVFLQEMNKIKITEQLKQEKDKN